MTNDVSQLELQAGEASRTTLDNHKQTTFQQLHFDIRKRKEKKLKDFDRVRSSRGTNTIGKAAEMAEIEALPATRSTEPNRFR
jgi:predicted secreted Zn-dependent protease